jgi:iron complex outermembrane receptor protein
MDNFQWSFIYGKDNLNLDLSLFLRKQTDTIDWVRNSLALPWQARNVGSVTARGVDIDFNFAPGLCILDTISLKYSFLDLDRSSTFNYSKYIFDYLEHRALIEPNFKIGNSLSIRPIFIFERPISRGSRNILNISITYDLSDKAYVFLEGQNILNESYQEIEGVKADGRWFRCGFSVVF